MRQAKPSEADWEIALNFLNGLESIFDYEEPPDGAHESFDVGEDSDIAGWVDRNYGAAAAALSRCYWAGRTAIDNACDPSKGVLEWKPEIERAMRAAPLLVEACKVALQAIDEAYRATGFVKVAETSEQRQQIEAAIAAYEQEPAPTGAHS